MPKNRTRIKTATGAVIIKRPSTKLRIGTRKSGKSALLMSTEELQAVLQDSNKRRYYAKAIAALKLRGINAEMPPKPVKADPMANVL